MKAATTPSGLTLRVPLEGMPPSPTFSFLVKGKDQRQTVGDGAGLEIITRDSIGQRCCRSEGQLGRGLAA